MHDPTAQMLNSAHGRNAGRQRDDRRRRLDGRLRAGAPRHDLADDRQRGTPVVRERFWLTFQPGEVRVCASCHGLNNVDQAGGAAPANTPDALYQLLQSWKSQLNIKPGVFLALTRR